jgi:hypothetical protein
MTRQEVDDFLRGLGAEIRTTRDGYVAYKFCDKSTVMIRPRDEFGNLIPGTRNTGEKLNE